MKNIVLFLVFVFGIMTAEACPHRSGLGKCDACHALKKSSRVQASQSGTMNVTQSAGGENSANINVQIKGGLFNRNSVVVNNNQVSTRTPSLDDCARRSSPVSGRCTTPSCQAPRPAPAPMPMPTAYCPPPAPAPVAYCPPPAPTCPPGSQQVVTGYWHNRHDSTGRIISREWIPARSGGGGNFAPANYNGGSGGVAYRAPSSYRGPQPSFYPSRNYAGYRDGYDRGYRGGPVMNFAPVNHNGGSGNVVYRPGPNINPNNAGLAHAAIGMAMQYVPGMRR